MHDQVEQQEGRAAAQRLQESMGPSSRADPVVFWDLDPVPYPQLTQTRVSPWVAQQAGTWQQRPCKQWHQ